MFLRRIATSFVVALGIAAGCAGGHAAMRGSVVMKIDPTKAHVGLGSGEVAVNDRVRLYRNACTPNAAGSGSGAHHPVCTKETVAEGIVTETLDDHYSVVTFPAGTVFQEGDTVEKI